MNMKQIFDVHFNILDLNHFRNEKRELNDIKFDFTPNQGKCLKITHSKCDIWSFTANLRLCISICTVEHFL